jgi:hypothetical protein
MSAASGCFVERESRAHELWACVVRGRAATSWRAEPRQAQRHGGGLGIGPSANARGGRGGGENLLFTNMKREAFRMFENQSSSRFQILE